MPEEEAWFSAPFRIRLTVADPLFSYATGDRLRFKTVLRRPKGFQNGGRDFLAGYYGRLGVQAVGFVSDSRWVLRLPADKYPFFVSLMERPRRELYQKVYLPDPTPARGLLLGLLIGELRLLGDEGRDLFQKNGLSHLLAISGLNVGMVALFFLFFFRALSGLPIFSRSIFWLRGYPLIAALPVWFYVVTAGSPISAVRAAVMATFVLGAMTLWRRIDFLNLLIFSSILMLLVSPLSLFSAAFQLSFVAVLFLILFFKPQHFWRDLFFTSGLVLLGLAPFLLYHFNEISLIGLVLNGVAVPYVNFVLLPLGMVGEILTGIFGLEITLFWTLLTLLSKGLFLLLNAVSPLAESLTYFGHFPIWKFPFYYGAFLFFKKQKLAVSLICVAWILLPVPRMNNELKISFLDVGQGESIVVQLPNKKVWLIDGGGIRGNDYDMGRFVIAPYLWNEGIRKVDRLFLTHPHHDHYKGIGFVAQHFAPTILYVNGDQPPEIEKEDYEKTMAQIRRNRLEIVQVTRDSPILSEGEVELQFLMPEGSGPQPHFDVNDNSTVMQLRYRDISILLSGDLMEMGERGLLESGLDLKSTVLKLGHHGSDTSTGENFLEAVSPKFAVMSLGEFNSYGMPGEAVLESLARRQIPLYRTDQQGGIELISDGYGIHFFPFLP